MSETKNIYQKLQQARHMLSEMKLKKTGKNTYSNFTYYELSDFLPAINKLNAELGITTFFQIKKVYQEGNQVDEVAYLDIINSDKPEEMITFESETAEVEIGKKKDGTGGADRIQNIGGKQTYLRRYLMIMAYEISEGDSVDAQRPKTAPVGKELDEASIAKIMAANTFPDLTKVCGEIISAKGDQYRKDVERVYGKRKEELTNANS